MTMDIIAIGGGGIGDRETLPIDEFIVGLADRKSPKVLFVPTAGGDDQGYCNTFDEIYGKELGCRTEHLLLLNRHKDRNQIREMILGADIIYVGGGNTLRMMKLWRKLGVDRYIEKAGREGTILTGVSAGAICWHQWGHSDSQSFSRALEWSYTRVKGLGLCPGTFCPHLDKEQRHESFSEMIQKHGGFGIACDNNAAVWYRDGQEPLVKCSRKGATVHLYRREQGEVLVETFHCGEELEIAKE
jgi:dipeptidase E